MVLEQQGEGFCELQNSLGSSILSNTMSQRGAPKCKAKAKATHIDATPRRPAVEIAEDLDSPGSRHTEAPNQSQITTAAKRFLDERTVGWDRFNIYVLEFEHATLEKRVLWEVERTMREGRYITPAWWQENMVHYLPEDHPLRMLRVTDPAEPISPEWREAVEAADNPIVTMKVRSKLINRLQGDLEDPNQRLVVAVYRVISKSKPAISDGARMVFFKGCFD